MNHLTRTQAIKQAEIRMGDGSILLYNIDITIQTEQEYSIAYQKIIDLNNFSLIEPMEQAIVHILNDCPDGDEQEEDED